MKIAMYFETIFMEISVLKTLAVVKSSVFSGM